MKVISRRALLIASGSLGLCAAFLFHWKKQKKITTETPRRKGPSTDFPQILRASVSALTGLTTIGHHYADLFAGRMIFDPGLIHLFNRIIIDLEQKARDQHQTELRQLSSSQLVALLREEKTTLDAERKSHFVQPIFQLFAHTDAWQLVGYKGWTGLPRGINEV